MKTCRDCGVEKPLEEFYKNGQHFFSSCKPCIKKRHFEYRRTPAGKALNKRAMTRYRSTQAGKEAMKRGNARRTKAQLMACAMVQYAIKMGRLQPLPCIICGAKANAHHSSYDEDMRTDVTWLCPDHHMELHRDHEQRVTVTNPPQA